MTLKHILFGSLGCILAACSPADTGTSESADVESAVPKTLTIYSARHYDSDALMYAAFEEATGIKVNVREGKATQLLETMKAEGANSPADVILAADAGSLWRFQTAGLTQALESETLRTKVPAKFRQADSHWYGVSQRLRGVVYDNSQWTAEDVSTWQALMQADKQGEICVRSSSNIYNLSLLAEMIERIGETAAAEWAEAVQQNMARQPQGGDTDQIRAVAAGQCSIAIVNHYYLARLSVSGSETDRDAAAKVSFAVPDFGDGKGAHVNVTAAALTATSANADSATAFVNFLMEPQGQTFLTMETRELPMLSGVALPEGAGVLPAYAASQTPLSIYGEHQVTAQKLYDLAGWN